MDTQIVICCPIEILGAASPPSGMVIVVADGVDPSAERGSSSPAATGCCTVWPTGLSATGK